MAETPKNRRELKQALGDQALIIETIESLGLRIVPADPTDEMLKATGWLSVFPPEKQSHLMPIAEYIKRAIAASPFAPENPNG